MTKIDVNASQQYSIHIGSGLLSTVGQTVQALTNAQRVCIVSDDRVWPLYGNTVNRSLTDNGFVVCKFQFPSGENSKNPQTYLDLLNVLAENQITRSDCIIALGGGVVGDIAGFAAATYLRGIPYIQLPTSLLAMVDSSVGGKTAIDLPSGKNLCGAFYHPVAVLCDTDTLRSLPQDIFLDGCSEVIKYAVLFDPQLFDQLFWQGPEFDRERVISRCVEHKRNVVQQDELDTAQRMLLNLGHTIGHAIEKCSNYSISHGKAVTTGMAIASRAANCPDAERITSLLSQFGLPTTTTDFSAEALTSCALSDKKRNGDTIHLVIPRAIGHCEIIKTHIENLKTFIEEGM